MDTDTQEFEDLSALFAADDEAGEPAVYELGYHLLPTLSEDEVTKEVQTLTDLLKKQNADFVGERFPAEITLAYPIDTKVDGARKEFATAYFGWIAFEIPASSVHILDEALKANEHVLRFMVTKTSRDQVAAVMADPGLDIGAPEPEVEVSEVVGADTEGGTEGEEVAEEEDKA